MRIHSTAAILILAFIVTVGCGVTRDPSRLTPDPTAGLPEQFVPDGASAAPLAPGTGCRGRLIDPATGTRLTLMRSGLNQSGSANWGDYAVAPQDSFGLAADRLVRLDCGTGRPIGTVPRDL